MTVAGEAWPQTGSVSAGALIGSRLDKLGAAIAAIVAVALVFEPFATLRPNRIVSGKGVGLLDALPSAIAAPCCSFR